LCGKLKLQLRLALNGRLRLRYLRLRAGLEQRLESGIGTNNVALAFYRLWLGLKQLYRFFLLGRAFYDHLGSLLWLLLSLVHFLLIPILRGRCRRAGIGCLAGFLSSNLFSG